MGSEQDTDPFESGLDAIRSGNYSEAIGILSEYVELHEEDHRAWNALGIACAKLKRFDEADICFENCLILAPDDQRYLKNRNINSKHVKSGKESGDTTDTKKHSLIDLRRVNKKYLTIGIAALIVLLIIFLLTFFLSPPHPSGPGVVISANQTDTGINLMNLGGYDIGSVTGFTWKINDRMMGTGTPGDPHTLGLQTGSAVYVPYTELMGMNMSAGLKIMVLGSFRNGSSMILLDTRLPPPRIQPREQVSVQNTPVPVKAVYNTGDVVYDRNTGNYLLIMNISANGTYSVTNSARTPNLSWIPIGSEINDLDLKSLESSAVLIGPRRTGINSSPLSGQVPPPVTDVQLSHPPPIYQPGDLVNRMDSDNGTLVILNYDTGTDQYQADEIYKYYTQEWGFRTNDTPDWYIRNDLEGHYVKRVGHITISDIGVGSDSSPPRSTAKYLPGEIIGSAPSSPNMTVIIAYNRSQDQYQTAPIEVSFGSTWRLIGDPIWEKRIFVERDNPYRLKQIDLSLIEK